MSRALEIEGARIALDGAPLISLSARVPAGAILTVMGPSGSGKSTLLAWLAGAPLPAFRTSGRVRLDGRDLTHLPPRERQVGLIFQDDLLFPHMSVGGNLAFGLPPQIRGARRRAAAIEAALESAGLSGYAARDPATLSGGQRSRVALLRTLLSDPQALLLDEPFSRLDAALRDTVRRFTFDTVRDRGLPAVLVTHDAEDARAADGPVLDPFGQALDPG